MEAEILFTSSVISIPRLVLPSREIGACVEFQGLVREIERGSTLEGLEYEIYEPMASQQLERIFAELHATYAVDSVTFIHRLGWVPVGEASMFVRVLSAHRGAALAFCGAAIDRMKLDVPIWKRLRS